MIILLRHFSFTTIKDLKFISLEKFNRLLDNLYKNSREGDILNLLFQKYYLYADRERKVRVKVMLKIDIDSGLVLPRQSLRAIRYYKVHELKDIEKLYPRMNIKYIEIIRDYYPPELYEIPENQLAFPIWNKDNIDEESIEISISKYIAMMKDFLLKLFINDKDIILYFIILSILHDQYLLTSLNQISLLREY